MNGMSKRIIGVLWLCLLMQGTWAQTMKTITVSQQTPYIDHLSLANDSRDKDLMVKFTFDEGANTLTVSLISYRSIFVFWDQVRYKPAVWNGKVRQKHLPYVVEDNPDTKFKLSRQFKHSIPIPRQGHIFNRWITVEGLQPVPAPYKMVNAIVEQKFDIVGKREMVKVTLHDILLMDKKETRVGRPERYIINFSTDLNMHYQVLISRDPCFGMEEDIAASENACASAENAAQTIKDRFGSGVVNTQELLSVFEQMKELFLQQFPAHEGESTCPTVNESWEKYNSYVSEIASLQCKVGGVNNEGVVVGNGVNERLLLVKAREIDNMVSKWLLSNDAVERRDIVNICNETIGEIEALVKEQGIRTEQQRDALSIFRQAVQYYQKKTSDK